MSDNLETTTVKETPNHIPRGDINPEGMILTSLAIGSLLVLYGIYQGGKKLYNFIGEKAIKNIFD